MLSLRSCLSLLAVLVLLPASALGAELPAAELAGRFFAGKLQHGYAMVRIDGIAGLARLERAAAVPDLAEIVDRASGFERLAALWALARIGTPEALAVIGSRADEESDRLRQGSFYEIAARTAFLAAAPRNGTSSRLFDRLLPRLYNAARKGRLDEQLLAAWALTEIGTSVTVATANEAMAAAAQRLDPKHGNYTRHLLFARLIGPPAAPLVAPRLEELLRAHTFAAAIAPKRALTAFTLTCLAASEEPPVLAAYRRQLARDLDRSLHDFGALTAIRALGPYACTPAMVERLRARVAAEHDEEERELAAQNLRMCGG